MEKQSKIYLAGHDGLVGSAFFRRLKEEGFSNIIYRTINELDLRDQAAVEDFFKENQPEYVIVAAAKVGGILANNTYKAEFIYDNLMIAANIIHSSYKNGVKRLLNLGSSCIYPKFAPQPMKEEHLMTGELEPTNEAYAIAKIAAIKMCRYYNEQYGTDYISVMPTNMYGPNDNYNLETSHVLPAMIRKFHLAKLLGSRDMGAIRKDIERYPLGGGMDAAAEDADFDKISSILSDIGVSSEHVELWGSGEPFREFLYVDDLVDAVLYLMEDCRTEDIGELVNIGTGKDMKIKDIAALIKDIVGFSGEIKFDKTKPDGTPKKQLDVKKLEKLGWSYKTKLEDGIALAYRSYLENAE